MPRSRFIALSAAGPSEQIHSADQELVSGVALAGANAGMSDKCTEDGLLWSAEIASLDLSQAELVVLSACQTGLGEIAPGEGLLGMQRALQVAGARRTLTALWEVNTHATAARMARFYENLWSRKMPTAEALRQAQIAMLRSYDPVRGVLDESRRPSIRTSPHVWAGFVLNGDWR